MKRLQMSMVHSKTDPLKKEDVVPGLMVFQREKKDKSLAVIVVISVENKRVKAFTISATKKNLPKFIYHPVDVFINIINGSFNDFTHSFSRVN